MKWNNLFKWLILRQLMYGPLLLTWIRSALATRSMVFFSACNPEMNLGGLFNSSKYQLLKHLSSHLLPSTIFVPLETPVSTILEEMESVFMVFPLIIKPDRGERGWKVRMIEDVDQLHKYFFQKPKTDLLLQEFIDYPQECCVLYYRYPNEETGTISSLGIKEFLSVTGDGTTRFWDLIKQDKTLAPFVNLDMLADVMDREKAEVVLDKGETLVIHYVANQGSGVKFRDYNDHISPEMTKVFDQISKQIPDFYYGRFDVKTKSLADLKKGNMKILEINGVNGMPIHTYDPDFPKDAQLRVFKEHWQVITNISRSNHKRGVKYKSFTYLVWEIIHYLRSR